MRPLAFGRTALVAPAALGSAALVAAGGAAPDFATGGLTATFGSDGERATFAGDGDLSFAGLVFTKPFTLDAAAAVVKGGTLVLEHGGALGRRTDVYIEGDGVLELAAGVVQRCRDLYFDGVRQSTGTWGSLESGAAHADDARFAGTGVLDVLSDSRGMTLILR